MLRYEREVSDLKLFEYIDVMNHPYDIFYTDNVHSCLHWHYYSEIIYIISGSVRIICNNKEILAVGDLCAAYLPQKESGDVLRVICRRNSYES